MHAQLGIPVAPAFAGYAVPPVEWQRVLQLTGDPVHLGVLDESALARDAVAPVKRSQDLKCAHHAAPVIGEPDGVFRRRSAQVFLLAGHAEVPTLRLAQDVVGRAHAPRSPATKAA